MEGRSSSATQNLRTKNAQLQATLAHARDERDRFARDLGSIKRETEETWASERVENALLRERINDVAAEVARLASALEGPNSPIDALLAAETSRGLSPAAPTVARRTSSHGAVRQQQSGGSHPGIADTRLPSVAERRSKNTQTSGIAIAFA